MSVTICHASIDEHGTAHGGAAGDQTGKEVKCSSWYSKPWDVMLRYPDASIAKKAAEIAKKLADSELVGYDQYQRNTLYQALKKHNWNVDAYIKSGEKTETDCSAFMYACYCCLIPAMRADGNAPTTSTMSDLFTKHGFTAFTDSKYKSQDAYLQVGDVLVKKSAHTVMAITAGSKAGATTTTGTTTKVVTSSTAPTYTVGKLYTTQVDLNVRTGAGTGYGKKKLSQLTADGRSHSYEIGGFAVLRANTQVTCKATAKDSSGNIWMQTPSGWLAAYYNKSYYIK